MCDTFVALSDATLSGDVIFGKNSDRPAGEIQDVVTIPALTHSADALLECTYLTIPQAPQTLAVILSKPRWMWGAEMGVNQCGVAIGNEAVWTIEPYRTTGLLGMDLVRLGLERGKTALDALKIIIQFLEEYGQGGNCAENFVMNYHNSFLIADRAEAWVLETAGKYWIAERVTWGTRSISNNLSIRNAGTIRHPELIPSAMEQGFCTSQDDFDFAKIFAEVDVEDCPSPDSREGRVLQLCQLNQGKFTQETAQNILRDHRGNVCMHGTFVSAGSQISSLSPVGDEHWFIEQPFPCQQAYKKIGFSAIASSL
jgi:secernin